MGNVDLVTVPTVTVTMSTPRHLPRVLEPEAMDSEEEARDYDAMDHSAVNARFCDDLLEEGVVGDTILDVGTGTALIPVALCARNVRARIVAIDLGDSMLHVAA